MQCRLAAPARPLGACGLGSERAAGLKSAPLRATGATRMITRRHAIQAGALLAAQAAFARGAVSNSQPKTLLILGGTGFIGPHMTQEALRLGWKVTHFNRGKRSEGGVPGVETLIGDRKGQLDALRGRTWDALVDDTGYIPKYVKMSAELLAPKVGYCPFIS